MIERKVCPLNSPTLVQLVWPHPLCVISHRLWEWYTVFNRKLGMYRYKCEEGWRSPKPPKKIPAKPKFNKKESCIANKEERKVFKVGKRSCTPAGCEKNDIPFQKVHPQPQPPHFAMVHPWLEGSITTFSYIEVQYITLLTDYMYSVSYEDKKVITTNLS